MFLNNIENGLDSVLAEVENKFKGEDDQSGTVLSQIIRNNFGALSNFMNSNDVELLLGVVNSVRMNEQHALQTEDETTRILESGEKFVAEQEKRGFKVEKILSDKKIGEKVYLAKIAYIFNSGYKTFATVFAMPKKISQVEGYMDEMVKELTEIKAKTGTNRILEFNNSIISKVLMQNLSVVSNDPFFKKYFEFVDTRRVDLLNVGL
jgi:hypothetical protein